MPDPASRLSAALEGRYRIERELGEGGMATVYLAHDLKHERKVALKVLKPELAAVLGAERFLTEIKTTANLQHPHILPLHDSGEADGLLFYVMPFVEGESLADRLARERQLPVEEAVRIATGIAEALDYAHRQGVVHRDIKPANVLLQDGKPVISDFGIALAISAGGGGRLTETGLSLGTPHYMSPEQATGAQHVGPATDVYALGCVLYEMLVGEPPFTGSTPQAILGKIIAGHATPASEQRPTVPPNVDAVIGKALQRVPADRFPSGNELAAALRDPAFRAGTAQGTGDGHVRRVGVPLPVAASVALLLAAVAAWGWLRPAPEVPVPVSRYSIRLPDEHPINPGPGGRIAVAPDGSRFVYVAQASETRYLVLREMDALEATVLPGTEGATSPFFTPDGARVGFLSDGGWYVTTLAGGAPTFLRPAEGGIGTPSDGWVLHADGFVYGSRDGVGLTRVPESGGEAERLTTVPGPDVDHLWPQPLPGGRGILFSIRPDGPTSDRANWEIGVVDLESGAVSVLARGFRAWYARSGHLLWITGDGTLTGATFDERTLTVTGDPVALADGLTVSFNGWTELSISASGTLAYMRQDRPEGGDTPLLWVTRDGRSEEIDPDWREPFREPALSPDGTRLAVTVGGGPRRGQIWLKELPGGPKRQLTFEGEESYRPFWSPDGRSVGYVTDAGGEQDLYERSADGTGRAIPILTARDACPASPSDLLPPRIYEGRYSRDGEWILYRCRAGTNPSTLHARRREGGRAITLDADTVMSAPTGATLSPDGRWLAHSRQRGDRWAVSVRPFPDGAGVEWEVAANAWEPLWASDGRELYYRTREQVVAVEVVQGPTFTTGERRVLFPNEFSMNVNRQQWDVSPDDERFVVIGGRLEQGQGDPRAVPQELIVVENFFEELKRRVRPR